MTRTRRSYNRPGFVSRISYTDLEYHPWRQRERHKCSYCYDFQRHKHLRMARKAEVRQVSEEFAAYGVFMDDYPYDFADCETFYSFMRWQYLPS